MILPVFRVSGVCREGIIFSLVLILNIPAYLGIKGDQIFQIKKIWRLFYVQIRVLKFVSHVQFYARLNVSNLYVTNFQ